MMKDRMTTLISEFMAAHALPDSFAALANETYIPLAERVAGWQGAEGGPLGLALNGGQGTGKSTLAAFLRVYLERFHGLRVFVLSLDDLYLTRAERAELGERVHPLLATRGVPGTHDLGIGMDVAKACLKHAHTTIHSPVFEKANDDQALREVWPLISAPVDLLILEGWCVGALPEPEAALAEPINKLEREDDPKAAWRTYVNEQLKMNYQTFFSLFSRRVMLKAPDFDCILRWRTKQEHKLREKLSASGTAHAGLMDDAAVARFIMHYERLTRWMLAEMPARVDACIELNEAHGAERLVFRDDG
jgi:D-glycerate 3-kinase